MPGTEKRRFAAVLVAAGVGARCPVAGPAKQFATLKGRPLFLWPLSVLAGEPRIGHVVVATLAGMVGAVEAAVRGLGPACPVSVIAGGATRQESVRLSLDTLSAMACPPEFALVHDAARPFLSPELVAATMEAVAKHGACTAAVAASDTVKRMKAGMVEETLDRTELVLVQTPQAGRFDWLVAAHTAAFQAGISATDDAALLEWAGHAVAVVEGSPYNLKVTRPEDLVLSEALASLLLPGPTGASTD